MTKKLPRPVEVTKLKNGMTIVTDRMDHLESIALGLWIKAGSRDELPDQHGIAHFLEHMAFKGTHSRTARDIAVQIENVGGDLNAATSIETTSFCARILKKDVQLAIEILSDILNNSLFDPLELTREQHVILQEIGAAQDSPEDTVFDYFQETAFNGQALGRTIMGTPKTVSSFSSKDLRAYLFDHYHGPNMVLAASGAVDHDKIMKLVETRFTNFGNTLPKEPENGYYTGGEKRLKKDLMEAQIILGFKGRAYHADEYYASQVLALLLGGGMSSRLFQEVREKRGLCYSIHAFHWSFSDIGTFGIHTATQDSDVSELLPVILNELKKSSNTIEQTELDRARAQINAGLMMNMESPIARSGQIARQILLFGRLISNEELMERINGLTVQSLRDHTGRLFQESNPTLSAIGPIDHLPDLEEIKNHLS
ncbi:pitrilysin family protein [Candidatus Endowatersipora endosymbiont of Watersipora subatra]|uniref:M16 family metallopeptidase n=1 Tax=Candidatus Endowatersipora endosymbiont of Watersipora subatra TaxID=3077946 RepID=UPI00312CB3F6